MHRQKFFHANKLFQGIKGAVSQKGAETTDLDGEKERHFKQAPAGTACLSKSSMFACKYMKGGVESFQMNPIKSVSDHHIKQQPAMEVIKCGVLLEFVIKVSVFPSFQCHINYL